MKENLKFVEGNMGLKIYDLNQSINGKPLAVAFIDFIGIPYAFYPLSEEAGNEIYHRADFYKRQNGCDNGLALLRQQGFIVESSGFDENGNTVYVMSHPEKVQTLGKMLFACTDMKQINTYQFLELFHCFCFVSPQLLTAFLYMDDSVKICICKDIDRLKAKERQLQKFFLNLSKS